MYNCWVTPELDVTSDQAAQRISRAIDALRADYERQGYLTDDQVVRAVHKRKIEADGHLRVREALAEAGIAIEDSGSASPLESVEELAETSGDDAVRRYLVEIGKYRLLKPDEEITLGRRVQMGLQALEALSRADLDENERFELVRLHRIGRDAEQQMISANLRLVVSVAKRYSKTLSLDILDLIQEGTLGLIRAVERFDYQRGYKFSTYATWWILQGITRSIADKDRLIRLPVHITESLRKLQRLRRRLSASMWGAEPDPRELAIHLGWTVEKVRLLLSVADDARSMDVPVGDDEESSLADLLKSPATLDPEQIMESLEKSRAIDEIVGELDGRVAEIIRLRFGIGTDDELTLQEIGEMKGVTRERIRQIEAKGLKSLRRKSRLRGFWREGPDDAKEGRATVTENTVEAPAEPMKESAVAKTGVLATLFDRLPKRDRKILILRYGLNNQNAMSELDASARLQIEPETLRRAEWLALDALGHTPDSFARLLSSNATLRASLAPASRAARREARNQNSKEEATTAAA